MTSKYVRSALVVAAMLAASCGSDDDTSDTADVADQESATVAPTSPPTDVADQESATVAPTSPPTDDDATPSTQDTVDPAADTSGQSGGDQLAGVADVSPECVDALVTFLQAIEPSAEAIDWSGTSQAEDDIAMFYAALAEASEEISQNLSDCEGVDLQLTDGAEIELLFQIATAEAPGVLPWLEFTQELLASQG